MASSKYLEYEIALLLAKYGRSAVLEMLAKKLELTSTQLEIILQAGITETNSRDGRKESPINLLSELALAHPDKGQLLRKLAVRFENRTFLPELRDVRRFFEQHAGPIGILKTRAESLPKLLRLLAELDLGELEGLSQPQSKDTYSALGVISDAILRRNG